MRTHWGGRQKTPSCTCACEQAQLIKRREGEAQVRAAGGIGNGQVRAPLHPTTRAYVFLSVFTWTTTMCRLMDSLFFTCIREKKCSDSQNLEVCHD